MSGYSKRMDYMRGSADIMRQLFEALGDPGTISLGGGAPASIALPVEEIGEITAELFAPGGRGAEMLQYGNPRGLADLRQVVCDHLLAPKGINADPKNVVITSGGLEGLYLTAQVFLDPGDVVLVESPTFVQTLETFQLMEARPIACECDKDGFVLDKLEADIQKYKPKLIYVIPTFQNPSGNTTSAQRRKALAELGAKYDVLVLEDDPYSEMRYSGEELKPVKYYDKTGHVIYANSFSKIFSPGSRLGYVYAEGDIIDRMYDVKTATNAHTAMLSQVLCAEYFKRGNYPAHLKYIREVHKERRDAMMEALKEFMPEGVTWTYPDGGLFTWLKVPDHISTSALFEEVKAAGVTYLPGIYFYAPGQPARDCFMRISFSSNPPEVLREAVRRLAGVLRTKM